MTYFTAWIGPGEPVAALLAGRKPNGPAPSISPNFPGRGREAYYLLQTWIETRKLPGLRTDWGSHAALASHSEIIAFMEELYGKRADGIHKFYGLTHLEDRLVEMWALVDTLPVDGMFCLAAEEY